MKQTRPSLLFNSLSQAGVRVLGSACALVLTWLIARRSVAELGVFRTLFVYFLMCEFIPLLGMQMFLFCEISLHPDKIKKYTLHALIFALVVSVVTAGVLCTLALSGGYSEGIRHGLFIVAAGLPATAASLVGLSVLVGAGQATRFSLIQGVETLVRTAIGIVLILSGWGVLSAIAAMVVTRWGVLFGYWHAIKPLFKDEPWHFDGAFFRGFLRQVPTFAGITLLSLVTRFAAQTMLPWILDDSAAGQFAAAFAFIDLTLLVPTALTTNLMPVLSRKAHEPPPALTEACRQGIKVMATGVLPVCAIVTAISRPMFAAVLPGHASYAVSARVLEVIIWTCCLQAVDQVLSSAAIARGRQDIDLRTVWIGAVGLVVLLAICIPFFGVMGASIGVLGGTALLVFTRFALVGPLVPGLQPFELLWRPTLAAVAAMAAATAAAQLHWLAGAIAGGVAYLAVLAALGGFAQGERQGLLNLLQPKHT